MAWGSSSQEKYVVLQVVLCRITIHMLHHN